ncbi:MULTISPECIES: sensor histidine kinase [Phenylobacterium]|uniref:histidine kinase n=1 Tax=Phenylobacterium koreense TaxID=266125 RepID=A0ABV2EEA0_9CAUL
MSTAPLRLRPRTVIALMLAVAIPALAVGLLTVDRIGEAIIAERQRAVAAAARDYFVAFAHEEGLTPLARALDLRERTDPQGAFRYALYGADGRRLGGADLTPAEGLPPSGEARMKIPSEGRNAPWRVMVQPLSTGGTLVVYEDISERIAFRRALVASAGVALLAAIGVVTLAALWLNRRLLDRMETLAATAHRIAEGDLSARTEIHPKGDVFDRLGESMNGMLDRIEELMTGMRTITDSLAHDLRSPLTRMRADLSQALEPDLPERNRQEAIALAHDEADRALAMLSALMDIARAEAGLSRDMMEPVDLSVLVAEVGELFAPVVEDAGQTFVPPEPRAPLVVQGHELILRQAVGNLLHNAAQHAGPGAEVRLMLEEAGGRIRIVVSDTGPGIPEEHRGRVRERFVRLDEARSRPGGGLGLAIAAACAKLHDGVLDLEDAHPGLRVVIDLADTR